MQHKSLVLLLTILLLTISTSLATITLTNLKITRIDGDVATPDAATTRLTVPALASITLTFEYTNTDSIQDPITNYRPLLTYSNPNSLPFDSIISDAITTTTLPTQKITMILPAGYTSSSSGTITLSLYSKTTPSLTPTSTTTTSIFDTKSRCDFPNYCGPAAGTTCDKYTSQCTCGGGYSGTKCEITPCTNLNCVAVNLKPDFECNDDAPSCDCKAGFEGTQCDIALECQTINCNDGYIPFADEVAEIRCLSQCECDAYWEDPPGFALEGSPGGCTKCSLMCQNGGTATNECTGCTCPLGFSGTECKIRYSVGKLTIGGLADFINLQPFDTTITPTPAQTTFEHARNQFLTQLQTLVVIIAQLQPSEVSLDSTNTDNTSLNILFRFSYVAEKSSDGTIYAPRLSAIQNGWKRIINDLTTPSTSLFKAYTNSLAIPITPATNTLNILSGADDITFTTPKPLWDQSCISLYSGNKATCSNGPWPFVGEEIKTSPSEEKEGRRVVNAWVIVVAVIFGVIAICGIIGFVVAKSCGYFDKSGYQRTDNKSLEMAEEEEDDDNQVTNNNNNTNEPATNIEVAE